MFDVFKQVAESLYSYAKEYAKAKKERKEKIAVLYEKMATCLKETSAILKKGGYPAGRCGEIKTYAEELPDTIGSVIGKSKAKKYSKSLLEVYEVEQQAKRLSRMNVKDRERELVPLEEAAGKFQALANLIRAT